MKKHKAQARRLARRRRTYDEWIQKHSSDPGVDGRKRTGGFHRPGSYK